MSNFIKHQFTITYEQTIDTETGEIIKVEIVEKSKPVKSSRKKIDEPSEPKLILEDNKYHLTSSAVELMEVQPDDKIDIKYEQRGNSSVPIIGSDTAWGTHSGNRLTKSLTVAMRGAKNEELAKHGSEFTLVPHPQKPGLFILNSPEGALEEEEMDGDENINTDDLDLSLEGLVDEDATEVDAKSLFQL